MTEIAEVVYPENVVDVSSFHTGALDKPKSDYINAFQQIYRGAYLIRFMYSFSEVVVTSRGEVRLDKDTYSWWLGNKEVGLVYLYQNFPKLKEYIVSKTQSFIQYRRDEVAQGIYGNRDVNFIEENLELLKRELNTIEQIEAL